MEHIDHECEKWYSVKLLFEAKISGEPQHLTIDDAFDESKTYEERLYLIYAGSFEEAYEKAEREAKDSETNHINPYGQLVEWVYVQPLDCFHLFEDEIKDKTEIYSRQFDVSKETSMNEVLQRFFPEVTEEE
ncbi:DUF4288 domain-containing protein [Paenibacillus prosopidis]|uniref:Uncharacterized protein DUF4288 n=1 Tax=Paenibacillus prosopidis TaxID=630520 RepID=A0A368VK14_9BACL|nr:DUF4288 domain-containing protein [Paenibacillus prosopidis]RCW40862.1 uncharacterized protein DUF4288 [Paenibacillus prosopidis]